MPQSSLGPRWKNAALAILKTEVMPSGTSKYGSANAILKNCDTREAARGSLRRGGRQAGTHAWRVAKRDGDRGMCGAPCPYGGAG